MKEKIIIATANAKKDLYAATADEFSAVAPNIQLGLLYSYVKSKGLNVLLVDSEVDMISIDGLIEIIEEEKPLLLGLVCTGANPSSSTMTMAGIVDFFKKFNERKLDTKTFVWGPHPTVLPERTLNETEADFVVRGEGYDTIVDLFSSLKNGGTGIDRIDGLSYSIMENGTKKYIHTKDAPLVKNLDTLPMIDWDTMNPARYKAHNWHCLGDIGHRTPYAILWTSFGCPFKCNFCCINNLFGKRVQRFRSVDRLIEEISFLVERFGVKHLKILDELFVTRPNRIIEFCDKLEKKGYDLNMWSFSRVDTISRDLMKRLKKVGMNWISYGFETTTPEILEQIKKGNKKDVDEVIKMTKDEGINICADVMFGLWDDDIESMNKTYEFLVKHNFEWVNMYPVFPYPGTDLYNQIEEPKDWKSYALYGYECVPMGTKHVSSRDVLKFRDEAFVNYHGRPEYLEMIEKKFGVNAKAHIQRMISTPLKRRLLQQQMI